MNVAIYIRVSTQEQKQHGISVDAQESVCRAWVTERRHRLVRVYNDAGLSARAKYKKRTAMLQLIDDIQAGKIDLIVFTKLDRWFRNVADYYEVQAILEQHNVKWRAIQEDYETETASGRFKVNIMLAVAQDEADRTSERIKATAEFKRQKGEAIGRAPVGYKIENKHFVIDPETEPAIRAFFSTYLETKSSTAAMAAAQREGVSMSTTRCNRTLRNRTYCGDHFGVSCPAYISEEEYAVIRENTQRYSWNRTTNRVYLFTGLMRCGLCGGAMTAACTSGRYHKTPIKHYRCCNHVGKLDACPGTYANEKKLETWLLAELPRLVTEYNTGWAAHQGERIDLSSDIKRIEGRLSRLRDLYIDGEIDRDAYDARSGAMKSELEELREKDAAANTSPAPAPVLPDEWRKVYNTLTEEGRRTFWRKSIRQITICPNADPEVVF